MTSFFTRMRGIRKNASGLAMTEFALSLPLLLTAGLYGAETANLVLTHMKISQLASHTCLADGNAAARTRRTS